MGFWDKIKNWLGINNKVKALPEGQREQSSTKYNQPISLTREDGSTIMITPICDKTGNQCYQEVLDHYSGERKLIAKFSIVDPALEQAITNRGSNIAHVLMDIDIEALKNEDYRNQVANVLLGSNRIVSVIDDREHYAGGVVQDEDGTLRCTGGSGIVRGLAASRIENAQKYAEAQREKDEAYKANIYRDAANITPSIETNGEQVLSPDMDPYR